MGLFLSRNLACKFIYPFLFSKRVSKDLFPKPLETMMSLMSPRTGRHLQRYDQGCRQVVGCVLVPSYAFFFLFLLLGFHQVLIFRDFLLSFVLSLNVSTIVILHFPGTDFNLNLLNL